MKLQVPDGVVVTGEISPGATEILTHDALELVAKVHREFNARRVELLKRRAHRQAELDAAEASAGAAAGAAASQAAADDSGPEDISMEEVLGAGTRKQPAAAKEEEAGEVPEVETQTY